MKLTFYKYQGAGNDFIIFDNRSLRLPRQAEQMYNKLCDRRFGIGADGIMLLQTVEGYDFEMVYYNADGSEGSMCGNGGRCLVSFAKSLDLIQEEAQFLAADGPHYAKISGNQILLQMKNVSEYQMDSEAYVLNTGSPHYVLFSKNIDDLDVYSLGKDIRYTDRYRKEGVNVNFVEENEGFLKVRTYERGVENETLSCGTGVTASAIAYAIKHNLTGQQHLQIKTPGGDLQVSFNREKDIVKDVFLIGPGTLVFSGEITLMA